MKACNRLRSKNHSHQRENSCQNDTANGVFQNLASASRVIGFAIGKSDSKKLEKLIGYLLVLKIGFNQPKNGFKAYMLPKAFFHFLPNVCHI